MKEVSEAIRRVFDRRNETPSSYPIPQEIPFNLKDRRLLVGMTTGDEFGALLERPDTLQPIIDPTNLEKNREAIQAVAAYMADRKHHQRQVLEVFGDQSDLLVAYLLRLMHPDLLIGTRVPEISTNQYSEVLAGLGQSLSLDRQMSAKPGVFKGRLVGRENTAIVILGAEKLDTVNRKRLKKELEKVSTSGLLIFGSNQKQLDNTR